jgi:hypothetical protein
MCNCGGGNSTPPVRTGQEANYEVSLPNGQTMTVSSEHEARVAITRAGGGTFSRK